MSLREARCLTVDRVDGGVTIVTLDDGKANVIGFELEHQAGAAIDDALSCGDALVVAGRAGRFSAGFDLSVLMEGPEVAAGVFTGGMDLCLRLLAYPRPVIAACTGHAVAGGALLLLACDVRIGLDGPFKIGFSEVSTGLPLPAFATLMARDRLDPRRLVMATLGAEIFDPAEAARVGFLDRVVATDVVDAATDEARRLAAFPASAYQLAKAAARRDLLERLRLAREEAVELISNLLAGGTA